MLSPGMGNDPRPFQFRPWAADNGRFGHDDWDAGDWLEWLAGLRRYRQRCRFAVAPDCAPLAPGQPGDAICTLALATPYLPTIRQLGYPAAYVAQNGIEHAPPPWGLFDVLFVGGDDAFKLSEPCVAVMREARTRGLWVHVGRVNTWSRLRALATYGDLVDSCDGTYLAFGPDQNWPRLCSWLDRVNGQPALEAAA